MDQAHSRRRALSPLQSRRGAVCLLLLAGCGDDAGAGARDASSAEAGAPFHSDGVLSDAGDASSDVWSAAEESADAAASAALPYAQRVERYVAGANAGFGRDRFPEIVLGPPRGLGTEAGSLDVLSLGVGGELVIDFGAAPITDGPGADFIVFENAFWPGGQRESVFAELGEVSVGDDLTDLRAFPCTRTPRADGRYPGCAGWTPTLVYDPFVVIPLDPEKTGGDAFDLAQLGLSRARYVRVRDLALEGGGINGGFDLDAVGVVHR